MQIPTYDKLLFLFGCRRNSTAYFAAAHRDDLVCHTYLPPFRYRTTSYLSYPLHGKKVSAKFPHSLDYVNIVELAEAGEFGDVIIDGPLDVKTSCEKTSGDIKGIASPINGEADVLIFPNIESGNAFYKAVSLFAHADMAGLLQGPVCPVVLPSRSDSGLSKYYSIAMACLTCACD